VIDERRADAAPAVGLKDIHAMQPGALAAQKRHRRTNRDISTPCDERVAAIVGKAEEWRPGLKCGSAQRRRQRSDERVRDLKPLGILDWPDFDTSRQLMNVNGRWQIAHHRREIPAAAQSSIAQ